MKPSPIPDAALEADIAILGKKGRGKTYTAKGCVERLLDMGRRVVVLDPLSTWWGLKAGPHGYPIAVLGGPQADLPITDKDGAALGRYLAGANQSAVIDLGAMRKAEMVRFSAPFFEELYTVNRDPLWLVLEEADVFAPQNPTGETALLLGEVDRIARRGRQFGFRLITMTQRPARLHKDVLTQLSTLVALGITSPQDRDAIKAWVEGNADRDQAKAVVDSLASLKVGEGWVWAPDLDILERVTFPKIRTLDTSATPKAGEIRAAAPVKAVDVETLRQALTSDSPSTDRPKKGSAAAPDAGAIAAAEQRGFDKGYQRGLADGHSIGWGELKRLVSSAMDAGQPSPPASAVAAPAATPVSRSATTTLKRSDAPPAPGGLPSSARKMLAVLDTNPPVRRTWRQVATLAGLKARGGHFNAGRKALVDSDLVVVDGDLLAIRQPSEGARPWASSPAGLVHLWSQALSGAAPRILRAIFDAGGATSKGTIADELGLQPRGGHWNASWKELRDNGIVEEHGDQVRLSEMFQPSGQQERA